MSLFAEYSPDTLWPKHAWSTIDFLTKCSHPRAIRAREILDSMYSRWPDANKPGKFNALLKDDRHNGSFFEMYLFDVFTKLGFEVEVEPKHRDGTPDFRLNENIYVEAFTVQGDIRRKDERNYGKVMDWLDEMVLLTPYRFNAEVIGDATPVPDKEKERVQEEFYMWAYAFTDRDLEIGRLLVGQGIHDPKWFPTKQIDFGTWQMELSFAPIPRSRAERVVSRDSLFAILPGSSRSQTAGQTPLDETLKIKADKYKGDPIILAVNDFGGFNADHEHDAVFGPINMQFHVFPDGRREPASDWARRMPWWNAPGREHVKGLWFVRGVSLGSIGSVQACLYEATLPNLPERPEFPLETLRQFGYCAVSDNGEITEVAGERRLGGLLGYPRTALGEWDIDKA